MRRRVFAASAAYAARPIVLPANHLLMVAAHIGDLRAARALGLPTALVPRPGEHGPGRSGEAPDGPEFDLVAEGFEDLAHKLGV